MEMKFASLAECDQNNAVLPSLWKPSSSHGGSRFVNPAMGTVGAFLHLAGGGRGQPRTWPSDTTKSVARSGPLALLMVRGRAGRVLGPLPGTCPGRQPSMGLGPAPCPRNAPRFTFRTKGEKHGYSRHLLARSFAAWGGAGPPLATGRWVAKAVRPLVYLLKVFRERSPRPGCEPRLPGPIAGSWRPQGRPCGLRRPRPRHRA